MTASAVAGLGTLLALMTAVWAASVARRDVSIVDIFWSLAILAAACVYASGADGLTLRRGVVLAAVGLWAVRLSGYLAWRGWGAAEDKRYRAMRERRPRFRWTSLFVVFWLQAALAWVVSLPLLAVMHVEEPDGSRLLDALGALLFLVGFGFETAGDWQMARFKADPANRGRVCDRGLWRFTRHPNYFGEAVLWWGLWCLAGTAPGTYWTVVGPLLLTWLLLRVSGVRLLESDLLREKPAYRDYVARTSAFLPRPPRRDR
ncbi:MAG: DUF1295 domain-containing protein [Acidobacteria bacterium]|nr:DUF1295 domain-containing protein [Acidobacteriota bacterium]